MSEASWFDPQWLNEYLVPWGLKFAIAGLILFLGLWVAARVKKIISKLLSRTGLDAILVKFFADTSYWVLCVAVILAALEQVGFSTTSLLAIIGAAGLAIGLALKDSLSNFAAGIMLIIFRPFGIGHFIKAGGETGEVEHTGLFATTLKSADNKKIVVPNASIFSGTITNYSAHATRRIDISVGIAYDDDIAKAKAVVEQIFKNDSRVLQDPAPSIYVVELADSSVNLNIWPWVNKQDYLAVQSDLLQQIKERFAQEGISIPFRQYDVHLLQNAKLD